MLALTLSDGTELLLVPESIEGVEARDGRTRIYVPSGKDSYYAVKEAPMDIARLKAAWELRFTADRLVGELPIAVGMNEARDAILFRCCQLTANLREKEKAEGQSNYDRLCAVLGKRPPPPPPPR